MPNQPAAGRSAPDPAAPGQPGAFDDPAMLAADIKRWGLELGFARIGVANIDLAKDEAHFLDWLRAGFDGELRYMSRHGRKRSRPAELVPGTVSCISARLNYWPADAGDAQATLANGDYVMLHGRFTHVGQPANWIVADVVRLEDGLLAEHWDVIQDEAPAGESKSGLPMFGDTFPTRT